MRKLLATDEGRARFWAESAVARGGVVRFAFPDGSQRKGRRFELAGDGAAGTDMTLLHADDHPDTRPGWVSVLLALKAAADFGVGLRNHDAARTWEQGFVDD